MLQLPLWKTQGHRVLIFSQGVQMLDILEDYVKVPRLLFAIYGGFYLSHARLSVTRMSFVCVDVIRCRVGSGPLLFAA